MFMIIFRNSIVLQRLALAAFGCFLFLKISTMVLAQAREPRQWIRITDLSGGSGDEVGVVRTSEGVLHVAWIQKQDSTLSLMHTAITAPAQAGAPTPILTGWNGINNPAIIAPRSGGLRIFFGGLRMTPNDVFSQGNLYSAVADITGNQWKLLAQVFSASTSVYASPVGSTESLDGQLVLAWATTNGVGVHVGLDGKMPDEIYQKACCGYQPGLATDSVSGEVVLAWYSNATNADGLYTQTILPPGSDQIAVPGSFTMFDGRRSSISNDQRIGITGRLKAPGVYLAYGSGYPACKTVNLWKYKSEAPMVVASVEGANLFNVAVGPEGRLWVMWKQGNRLFAVRSNKAATRMGEIVGFNPPPGSESIRRVQGNGALGPMDALVLVTTGSSASATWHTQVFPRLSLSVSPKTLSDATGRLLNFVVSDAGDPVDGATITFAGQKVTSDAQGKAIITLASLPKPGVQTATASLGGYSDGQAKVTAK